MKTALFQITLYAVTIAGYLRLNYPRASTVIILCSQFFNFD